MVHSNTAGLGSCMPLLLQMQRGRETGVLAVASHGVHRGAGHWRWPAEVWIATPWRMWVPIPWRMWVPTPWRMCLTPAEAGSVFTWGRNTLNLLYIVPSCSWRGHAELAHPTYGDSWQTSAPSSHPVSGVSLPRHAGLWQSGAQCSHSLDGRPSWSFRTILFEAAQRQMLIVLRLSYQVINFLDFGQENWCMLMTAYTHS